jgi:hypothetical protein
MNDGSIFWNNEKPAGYEPGNFNFDPLSLGKTRKDPAFEVLLDVMDRPSWADVIAAGSIDGLASLRDERALAHLSARTRYGHASRVRRAAALAIPKLSTDRRAREHRRIERECRRVRERAHDGARRVCRAPRRGGGGEQAARPARETGEEERRSGQRRDDAGRARRDRRAGARNRARGKGRAGGQAHQIGLQLAAQRCAQAVAASAAVPTALPDPADEQLRQMLYGPTSPCTRDEFRRRLGKGHWESARAMFRHDTWDEYWAWFCEDSRNTASKIASMEYPEEAPRAFRDHHELDKAYEGGDSCLCVPVRQCRSWRQRAVQLRIFESFWIA